ncbi:unnamed protein product [Orchesella dallaii]|uniref:Uncharacterized protein n=1 Tax=Orchesella dallaii TaxID=48710 RepID=A0ABP1SA91_9HEXA
MAGLFPNSSKAGTSRHVVGVDHGENFNPSVVSGSQSQSMTGIHNEGGQQTELNLDGNNIRANTRAFLAHLDQYSAEASKSQARKVRELRLENESLQSENEELKILHRKIFNNQNTIIHKLRYDNGEFTDKLERVETEAKKKDDDIKKLSGQNNEMVKSITNAEALIKGMEAKNQNISGELTQVKNQLEEVTMKYENAKKELEQEKGRTKNLNSKVLQLENSAVKLNAEMDLLKEENRQLKMTNQEIDLQFQQSTTTLNEIKKLANNSEALRQLTRLK